MSLLFPTVAAERCSRRRAFRFWYLGCRSQLGLATKCASRRRSFRKWYVMVATLRCTKSHETCFVPVLERRLCGNVRYPQGHLPQNEQHGGTPGMPVALVHCLSHPRILVLHRRLVVSTMIMPVFLLVRLRPHLWIFITASPLYPLIVRLCTAFLRLPMTLLAFFGLILSTFTHRTQAKFSRELLQNADSKIAFRPGEKKRKKKEMR